MKSFHIFNHIMLLEKSTFMKIKLKLLKLLCTAKINSREICKPYLHHHCKYIPAKYLKERSAKTNSL